MNADTRPGLDAAIAVAQALVRTLDEQRVAETDAYWRGWRECYAVTRAHAEDDWQAGWDACETDMAQAWAEIARWVRELGSPNTATWTERHTAEMASCKPRPGDFAGVANDPSALDRYRAELLCVPDETPHREAA